MEIRVISGDITQLAVDAIVNPANSHGLMGGGVAGVIKRVGGIEIQEEAIARAPIAVGSAVMTTAGTLSYQGVIHAPTMERPAQKTTVEVVKQATEAALACAESNALESIAIPGMGTGVGGVPHDLAARMIVVAVRAHKPRFLQRVVLVDVNSTMVAAFEQAVNESGV